MEHSTGICEGQDRINQSLGKGSVTDIVTQAMVLHPKVQQEAQQEIDKVVGSDRMPEWEDRENLPYIRGIVEESLRCTTIVLSRVSIVNDE